MVSIYNVLSAQLSLYMRVHSSKWETYSSPVLQSVGPVQLKHNTAS